MEMMLLALLIFSLAEVGVGIGEVGTGLGAASLIGVIYKILSDIWKDRKTRPIATRIVNGNSNPGPALQGTTIQMILQALKQHDERFGEVTKYAGETRDTLSEVSISLARVEEQIKSLK